MRSLLSVAVIFACTACATQPTSSPLEIGNKVDFSLLEDQFGNSFRFEKNMELLIFTDDMQASRDVRDTMGKVAPGCYEQGKLVFMADISGMPRLITRLIALPKMRDYGFPVWLDYEGDATGALPVKDEFISMISINNGAITDIDFVIGGDAVLSVIGPLCGLKSEQIAKAI